MTDEKKVLPFFVQLCRALDAIPVETLPRSHRAIMVHMSYFSNPDGTNTRPSIPTLMQRSGYARSPLCRFLAELEAGKWIVPTERGLRDAHGYRLPTNYAMKLDGKTVVLIDDREKPWIGPGTGGENPQGRSGDGGREPAREIRGRGARTRKGDQGTKKKRGKMASLISYTSRA